MLFMRLTLWRLFTLFPRWIATPAFLAIHAIHTISENHSIYTIYGFNRKYTILSILPIHVP